MLKRAGEYEAEVMGVQGEEKPVTNKEVFIVDAGKFGDCGLFVISHMTALIPIQARRVRYR